MNNYRKSKIFGKKEKFNLFLLVGIALTVITIMYFSSKPTKVKESQKGFKAELSQNDSKFQQELNINDNNNVMDNAIQVKEDNNKKPESDIKNNQNNLAETNKNNDLAQANKGNEVAEKTNDKVNDTQKNLNEEKTLTKDLAEKESQDVAVSSPNNISFVIPVEGNVIREFTTDTVFSKTLNTWRTREGIDFKAEIGAPVVSVLDGVVEKIDNDLTERGQYIVVKHNDGFKTVYTNLDEEVKVVNGQKVRKGEVIATVGNTSGNYSNEDYGSHFNFVMYLNNEEVNPSEYIKLK